MSAKVIEALQVTAQIFGRQFSEAAAKTIALDLSDFDPDAILVSLRRCRLELKTFPTVADIIARIDDGRPGPEEAWGMIPQDERASVVWTEEMRTAYGACMRLLDDPIAARMAFKETYTKAVADARARKVPPRWSPSLGHDLAGRAVAVREATEKGRLTFAQAAALIPDSTEILTAHKKIDAIVREMTKPILMGQK